MLLLLMLAYLHVRRDQAELLPVLKHHLQVGSLLLLLCGCCCAVVVLDAVVVVDSYLYVLYLTGPG